MAPTFIAAISRLFRGAPPDTDNRIREMNEKIRKIIADFTAIRVAKNPRAVKKEHITLIINKTLVPNIAFAESYKNTKDSCVTLSFGLNRDTGTIWIGTGIDLSDNISYFLNEQNSFIFHHSFFTSFINKIAPDYIGKDLNLSCVVKLKHSNLDHKDFFEKAVFGMKGSFTGAAGFHNANLFASGDVDIVPRSSLKNTAYLSSKDPIISKSDIRTLFDTDKFYLIAAVSHGSQMIISGKMIGNITIGIFHEEYLRSLRNYVEIFI